MASYLPLGDLSCRRELAWLDSPKRQLRDSLCVFCFHTAEHLRAQLTAHDRPANLPATAIMQAQASGGNSARRMIRDSSKR